MSRSRRREALYALPVADLVIDERGELRPYVNVYVDARTPATAAVSRVPHGLGGAPGRRDALGRLAKPLDSKSSYAGRMLALEEFADSARDGGAGRPRDRVRDGRSGARRRAPGRSAMLVLQGEPESEVGLAGVRRRARRGLSGRSRRWRGVGDGAPLRGRSSAVCGTAGRARTIADATT